MPKLILACMLILATALPPAPLAADWPEPASAWLKTPDGYLWPENTRPLDLREVSTAGLDSRLQGRLIPALESTAPPATLLAAWVDLEHDGERALLYVDPALSGTGGKYLQVVARIEGEWSWIGEMLCRQVLVGAPEPGGWRDLICIGQRGLQYQRVLHTLSDGRYCAVRNEQHDLERGVVEILAPECGLRADR